ncbi:MAG: translation factor GTPase family protein [Actinocatenispora sp.]
MSTLNLGILAHVDAGKTSLTERLLHAAGVIDTVGSVDEGNTRTDSLALEQQRGITIKSAVVSFPVDDVTVNLIDTPGHPDFIAEVERVLAVLDGAVLVVSAVEGVQAQTRVLMRTLRRLRIPTLIFVNKLDRVGADPDRVLRRVVDALAPSVVPMGSATDPGTHAARYVPYPAADPAYRSRLVDVLADHDDDFLAAYVEDEEALSDGQLRERLAAQTGRGVAHPVFLGSAITGTGVPELIAGIREFLPAVDGDADAPVSGTVFKVERGPAGERIAYVHLLSGTVRTRDRVRFGEDDERKVTAVRVFDGGDTVAEAALTAGRIGMLWGLGDVRIGDAVGLPRASARRYFSPPTLETVVAPCRASDGGALHVALTQLAEQDPLINLRHDGPRRETYVSLYGEVQKEVIQATLAAEYGLDVTFHETTTICVERVVGTGTAVELIATPTNPFLGTVGLRVEPAAVGSGVRYRLGIEPGSLPLAFRAAIEDTVTTTLGQGLDGWQVTDCTVTLERSGYWARQSHSHGTFDASMSSTAGDFRGLTPLVLMTALREAGTVVCEPMHRFRLDAPADTLGSIFPALVALRAVPRTHTVRGTTCVLEGDIPAARVHALEQQLPALTRGEGVLDCAFDHHRPVSGAAPTRARSDHNPLNRKEYLLHVTRRV